MGGVATTITVGGATGASTINLGTGATVSGSTKSINIGTGGSAGSTTNISIGASSGTSATTINGSISVTGNTTLGDASGDSITLNASTVSVPNNLNIDSNTLYIDSTNNHVGVGTSSPSASLDVVGSSTTTAIKARGGSSTTDGIISLKGLGAGGGAKITFGTYGSGLETSTEDYGSIGHYSSDFIVSSISGRDFKFNNVNGAVTTTLMTLGNTSPYSGKLGIGTATPGDYIDVASGGIKLSSTLAQSIAHTGAVGATTGLTISSAGKITISPTYGSISLGGDITVDAPAGTSNDISFNKATVNIASNSTPATINLGSYAASTGTKTINIGNAATSGNTTSINIGSSAGATSDTHIYGDLDVTGGSLTLKGSVTYFNPSSGTTASLNSSVVNIELFTNGAVTGTMNIGTNCSKVSIGSTSGSTEVNNNLSIPNGSIIGGLSANTSGNNTIAAATEIPYSSAYVSRLSPTASLKYYKLPTAAGNSGLILIIKNVSATNDAVLYTGVIGQTIDSKYTYYNDPSPSGMTLTNTAGVSGINAVTVYSNGSDWFVINSHRLPMP